MSDEKANTIAAHFQKVSFPKGTLLIEEGKTSKYSYFLEAGIIRCYLIDREGLEVTLRFYSAPDFFNDFLSFFEQKPSGEYYELLTDCTLHTINYDKVQHCFHQIPEFREWGRMLLTLNYAHLNQRVMAFHKQTASERYLALKSSHPEIIQNVPLTIIASYLGITKFSLSRIRKEFG
ncbi:MAG: Crp/Fnr family transcriptional regulator [Bacteroidota bacterium]